LPLVAPISDPPFAPYEKIAESLADWLGDDEPAYRASNKATWIVTEKVHGANFCLITDGTTVHCAKRKELLSEDADFFGHKAVLVRLGAPLGALFAHLKRDDSRVHHVFVYGELYGGGYPHPDVPAVPGVSPIQTGVWYSPRVEFIAFDVAVERDGSRVYLDQDDAMARCEEAGIPFSRSLFRGTYEDAFAYPLGFETTLPASLGLPPLGPTNKAEGIVLKPARAIVVPRREGAIRPVIKRKIAEFAEDGRFHQAEKWAAPRAAAGVLPHLEYEASLLVNENRLRAAVSKVGPTRADDAAGLAAVFKLIREDLDAELAARHASALASMSPLESAALSRYLDEEARALVELYLGAAPP
jgi:Rnl2 family RNA ligase